MGKIDKIRLKNFKSFKSATIPISLGYTTIVGPNGSGKSNIVDSLCFVLGTSSMKTLRADRLGDLVHNNSKDGTADVFIDLNTKEGIRSVSRSIDKGGNSVFRLDGKRTTKFQIEETLSDLNIKSDGHNIIMQGDITKVIKMTPMQRREIIDEVSGIAEYEDKKQESIRELNKVLEKTKEANIIIGERSGYLNVLEKEKIEAELYQRLNRERKQYAATLTKKELDSAEKSYTKILEYLAQQKAKLEEVTKNLGKHEQELRETEREYDEVNKRVFEESDKRQKGVREELEKIRQDLANIEAEVKHSKELVERNRAKREEILQEISGLGNKMKDHEKEVDAHIIKEEEIEIKIRQAKEELEETLKEAGKFDKNIGAAYKELDDLHAQIEKKREELHQLDSDINAIKERTDIKKSSCQTKEAELRGIREREQKLKETLAGFEKDVDSIQKEITGSEKALEGLYEKEKLNNELYRKRTDELVACQREMSSVESKISTLKNMTGLSRAVEAVLANKQLKGIVGTIADLCKYSKENATAIETAAGTRLFYVVTETADDATEAVKHLKSNQLGRATFIPLDKIKQVDVSKDAENALSSPGAVGLAIKLIDFDKRLYNAFSYVFGETVIVKDIDGAKSIGIGSVRMVTLDGDLCESSGIITGGYSRKGVSVAELRALDELKERSKTLADEKQIILRQLESLKEEIDAAYDEKSKSELKLREAEVTVKEWTNRLKEYGDQMKQAESAISYVNNEIRELGKAIGLKEESRRVLDEEINSLVEKRGGMKQVFDRPEVKELNEKIRQKELEMQTLKDQKTDMQVKIRTLNSEIEKVLAHNRRELEKRVSEIDKDNEGIGSELEKLSKNRNDLIRLLKETEEKERELASSMKGIFKKQETLNKRSREIAEKIGEINRRADKIKEEMGEKSIDKAKVEIQYNELKKEWQKYQGIELLDESMVSLREKLNEVEKQLANLGNVNLKAIEMYEQISKEVAEIRERSKRLEQERESIMALITEIEGKKLAAFTQTFNALNEYFNKYFKELYPEEGSLAGMKLENPDEPLSSGLILEAKPLGKPLKTIDLLSGGEKSLTALAFLFAIQAYNPSPFYILDEVDAALDKENSERVARMLKKFSKEIQFIIITHNAAVTKNSDQIIGVHMSKEGSSLVEVDLKSYQSSQAIIT